MKKKIHQPQINSSRVALPVTSGGSGEITKDKAVEALSLISKTAYGQPGGAARLGADGYLVPSQISDEVLSLGPRLLITEPLPRGVWNKVQILGADMNTPLTFESETVQHIFNKEDMTVELFFEDSVTHSYRFCGKNGTLQGYDGAPERPEIMNWIEKSVTDHVVYVSPYAYRGIFRDAKYLEVRAFVTPDLDTPYFTEIFDYQHDSDGYSLTSNFTAGIIQVRYISVDDIPSEWSHPLRIGNSLGKHATFHYERVTQASISPKDTYVCITAQEGGYLYDSIMKIDPQTKEYENIGKSSTSNERRGSMAENGCFYRLVCTPTSVYIEESEADKLEGLSVRKYPVPNAPIGSSYIESTNTFVSLDSTFFISSYVVVGTPRTLNLVIFDIETRTPVRYAVSIPFNVTAIYGIGSYTDKNIMVVNLNAGGPTVAILEPNSGTYRIGGGRTTSSELTSFYNDSSNSPNKDNRFDTDKLNTGYWLFGGALGFMVMKTTSATRYSYPLTLKRNSYIGSSSVGFDYGRAICMLGNLTKSVVYSKMTGNKVNPALTFFDMTYGSTPKATLTDVVFLSDVFPREMINSTTDNIWMKGGHDKYILIHDNFKYVDSPNVRRAYVRIMDSKPSVTYSLDGNTLLPSASSDAALTGSLINIETKLQLSPSGLTAAQVNPSSNSANGRIRIFTRLSHSSPWVLKFTYTGTASDGIYFIGGAGIKLLDDERLLVSGYQEAASSGIGSNVPSVRVLYKVSDTSWSWQSQSTVPPYGFKGISDQGYTHYGRAIKLHSDNVFSIFPCRKTNNGKCYLHRSKLKSISESRTDSVAMEYYDEFESIELIYPHGATDNALGREHLISEKLSWIVAASPTSGTNIQAGAYYWNLKKRNLPPVELLSLAGDTIYKGTAEAKKTSIRFKTNREENMLFVHYGIEKGIDSSRGPIYVFRIDESGDIEFTQRLDLYSYVGKYTAEPHTGITLALTPNAEYLFAGHYNGSSIFELNIDGIYEYVGRIDSSRGTSVFVTGDLLYDTFNDSLLEFSATRNLSTGTIPASTAIALSSYKRN